MLHSLQISVGKLLRSVSRPNIRHSEMVMHDLTPKRAANDVPTLQ
jgi:hypothetical protein